MTAVSTAGTAPRPRSPRARLRARLVLAGLSACGLAALAWASFAHPLPRLIYNPSDSVAAGRLARETAPDSAAAREITALVDELLRWTP